MRMARPSRAKRSSSAVGGFRTWLRPWQHENWLVLSGSGGMRALYNPLKGIHFLSILRTMGKIKAREGSRPEAPPPKTDMSPSMKRIPDNYIYIILSNTAKLRIRHIFCSYDVKHPPRAAGARGLHVASSFL